VKRLAPVAFATLLVACGSGEEVLVGSTVATGSTGSTSTAVSAPPDEASSVSLPTSESPEPSFEPTLGEPVDLGDLADGEPVDLAVRPGATPTSFLVLRGGLVVRLESDSTVGEVVLDVSDLTRAEGERGLLGVTFSDDGSRAWINHTDLDGNTRIVAFEVDEEGRFDETSATEVDVIGQPHANHNGGELVLDAARDRLLVLTGDGGAANDPDRLALDLGSPLGKILAYPLEPDGDAGPAEIVAVGLRNPWRAVIHDDVLWIADVGQGQWEEVNAVPLDQLISAAPVSFGWSALEGTHDFNDDQTAAHAAFVAIDPVTEYEHVEGRCSISGGAPTTRASGTWYVFADFCTGEVIARCLVGCGTLERTETIVGKVPEAVAVLPDHRGDLWVLGLGGALVPVLSDR